jgi:catalase
MLPDTRKAGVIIGNQFNGADVSTVLRELQAAGVQTVLISEKAGKVTGTDGTILEATETFLTTDSVLYDAVYAAGGQGISPAFEKEGFAFIMEAFKHFKTIGGTHEGTVFLEKANILNQPGVVSGSDMKQFAGDFIKAVAADRHWSRQPV